MPDFKSRTSKRFDDANVAANLPSRDREREPLQLENDE